LSPRGLYISTYYFGKKLFNKNAINFHFSKASEGGSNREGGSIEGFTVYIILEVKFDSMLHHRI
jgi:hypothetical protein